MSQISILGLILSMLASGPNELLDYIPSEAYWRQKGVAINVETMIEELKASAAAAAPGQEGGKMAAVRRLMAIRALGESKDQKALDILKPLLSSKEMFEADYAAAAIAAIEGKAYIKSQPDAKTRAADVNSLPGHLSIVAQAIQLRPSGKIPSGQEALATLSSLLKLTSAGRSEHDLPPDQFVAKAIVLAETVGNIRADEVTFGMPDDFGGGQGRRGMGSVILLGRGQYDHKATRPWLLQAITQNAPPTIQTQSKEIDGIPVIQMSFGPTFIFLDDQRLALLFDSPGLPLTDEMLQEVVVGLKTGAGKIAQDEDMTSLLKGVDTTKPLWAVARINENYRQLPPLRSFNSITVTAVASGPDAEIKVSAIGSDAAQVKSAVDGINGMLPMLVPGLSNGIAQQVKAAPGIQQIFQSLINTLKSLKVTAAGTNATGTATIKDANQSLMLIPSAAFFTMNGFGAMAPPGGPGPGAGPGPRQPRQPQPGPPMRRP